MKKIYDVIIVGAGPAGLKCAEVLGNSKLKVLLVEKKKIIGLKICGGGLTSLDSNFKLPIDKTLKYKTQYVILNGNEFKISLKYPLHIIDRYDLGQYQLGLVKKYNNIIIKKNILIKKICKKYIITKNNKRLYYKCLVGADGSTSIVRRYVGLKNKLYLGIQYKIPKKTKKIVWFFNPKLIKSGYGWIFPHKSFTSAGIFFNPRHISPKKAKDALNKLLDGYGLDYKNAKFEGSPTNCLFEGFQFGNIFLVGDAAGLVSADTGEGIAYALASGYDVAKHILDKSYNFDKIKSILKYKKRQEFFLGVFNKLPFIQSFMFRIFIFFLKFPRFQNYFGD